MRHLFTAAASFVVTAFLPAQTDAIHYKLEIEPNFAALTIQGTCTATYASTVNGLTTLQLDLMSALTVSQVRMGGNPVAFTRPTDLIVITLDRPYNVGEQFTVVVDYGGAPPVPAGFGGLQFVTTPGGNQCCWTLSEPWDGRGWWPSKDQLNDKATFEMWITHPATMGAASNGLLQGVDTLAGGKLRSRWQTNYPMAAYLLSLVVTPFSRRTDTYTGLGASMPVEFYVFPESFSSWTAGMNNVVPMLTAYSNVFGQYPFVNEKYGIAQFTWGGGMEHQTCTSQVGITESVTSHELAHQWWGDNITCETWSDVWLNEGFATFCEAVWLENKPGGNLASYLAAMVARKPTNTSGTVYVYTPNDINALFSTNNVYRKGGWALHMLRGVLGDATFFQGMRDYRAAFQGDSATTAEFRQSMEQTSGRDLSWFFDQWVMNPGSPTYNFAWANRTVGGQNYVYLEINQTQTLQNLFKMPVRMRITTSSGTITAVVNDDERSDQMVIAVPAPATAVALDPDQWILRATPTAGTFATPFFAVDNDEIDTFAGGRVEYHLDLGPASANRACVVGLSLSGSTPPLVVNGLTVPLVYDALTGIALENVNTPIFQNFMSVTDANGRMRSVLDVPAGLATVLAGSTVTAAAVRFDAYDFASRPVSIHLK